MNRPVELSIVKGDAADVEADMSLLKYATRFHGADQSLIMRLERMGHARQVEIDPDEGEYAAVNTHGSMSGSG